MPGSAFELAGDAVTPQRMADVLSEVLGRSVRHDQTPLESIRNPDMLAMWRFLNGPGYGVDVEALREENPNITWTSFAEWARQSIG
jgi:uncharacterized protein YbjT (DUF2867 family)